MVVAVNAPVLRVPLTATVPDQPPEALQEVALDEFQVRVVDEPLLTVVEAALSEAVGADAPPEPPDPPPQPAKASPATTKNKNCFIALNPDFPGTPAGRRRVTESIGRVQDSRLFSTAVNRDHLICPM